MKIDEPGQESRQGTGQRSAWQPSRYHLHGAGTQDFPARIQTGTAAYRCSPAGNTVQANEIARHLSDLADGLHLHHSSEDDLIWPKLLARAQPDTDLIARMQNQHALVVRLVDQLREELTRWRASASPEMGAPLARTCEKLSKVLDEHLGEEEAQILPLIEEHLTCPEWAEVGARGFAEVPKNRLLFFLGALCEQATSAERADFMRMVPLPGRLAFALFGERQYRSEVARLRSGLHDPIGIDHKLK